MIYILEYQLTKEILDNILSYPEKSKKNYIKKIPGKQRGWWKSR